LPKVEQNLFPLLTAITGEIDANWLSCLANLSQKWVKYSSTAVTEQCFNNMSKFP